MANTLTVEQIRAQLGQYLTKPVVVTTGTLSTQQDVSVTSIGAGGVQGVWKFGPNGSVQMYDENGKLSIYIGFEK